MLALAREWPVDDEIRPLFREWGYSVRAVGRKFALPISVYAALKDSVPMKIAAGPDFDPRLRDQGRTPGTRVQDPELRYESSSDGGGRHR